jgi:hypothetical protein
MQRSLPFFFSRSFWIFLHIPMRRKEVNRVRVVNVCVANVVFSLVYNQLFESNGISFLAEFVESTNDERTVVEEKRIISGKLLIFMNIN